jgi:hypothetical protein
MIENEYQLQQPAKRPFQVRSPPALSFASKASGRSSQKPESRQVAKSSPQRLPRLNVGFRIFCTESAIVAGRQLLY